MTVRQHAQSSDEFFYGPEGEVGGKKGLLTSEVKRSPRKARKQDAVAHAPAPVSPIAVETKAVKNVGRKKGILSTEIKLPSRKARKQEAQEQAAVPVLPAAETRVERGRVAERPVRAVDPLPAAPRPKRVVPVVAPPLPAAEPPPVPLPVSAPPAPLTVSAPPAPLTVSAPPAPASDLEAPTPLPPAVSTPVPSFDVNAPGSAPPVGPAATRWKRVGGMLVPDDGPGAPTPMSGAQQEPAEVTASQPFVATPPPLTEVPTNIRLATPQVGTAEAPSPFAIPTGVASRPDVADLTDTLDDSQPPTPRKSFKRRRRGRLLPALIAGLLVSGAAGYFAYTKSSTDAELVSFRYAYEAGDKRTYDITMQMDMKPSGLPDSAPFQGTMNATMGLDVVSKVEDGSTIIEIEMSNISVQPNLGTGGDIGKMRVSIAPDGRVTKVEGVGGPFGAAGIDVGSFLNIPGGGATDSASSQFLFPQFPNEGVRPGDSWTEETVLPLPFSDDPIKVTSVGTFEGYEQTTYGQAAQMHHVVTMPMNFSFTLAELFQSMAEITEGGAPPVPLEAQGARFVINGSMKMITDSLVLPGGGDITKMVGTTEMDLDMHIEGVPASALEGSPGEFSMAGTMSMTILRTDGAPAT